MAPALGAGLSEVRVLSSRPLCFLLRTEVTGTYGGDTNLGMGAIVTRLRGFDSPLHPNSEVRRPSSMRRSDYEVCCSYGSGPNGSLHDC